MAVKFTAYIYNKVSARLLALLVPAAVCLAASAQTDAQLSQYYELPNFYNPAATGTTDFLKLRADARLQWLPPPPTCLSNLSANGSARGL